MKSKIPSIFDMPPPRTPPGGKLKVSGSMHKDSLRAMIAALESVGYVVRVEDRGYRCSVSGHDLLIARRGNRGTYQVRYCEDVLKLMEKKSG